MTRVLQPTRTATRAAGVLAVLFAALTVVVALEPRWLSVSVDGAVSNRVRDLAGRTTLLDVTRVVTWLGHPLVVDALVLLFAAVLWRAHRPVAAVSLVVTGLVSLLVRALVKDLVARPRPGGGFSTATGGSFPSGHTAGAAFLAVAAIALLTRAWVTVVAVGYTVVVGASRIVLNVHWVSDVVGGVLLGATFGLLVPWAQTQIGERWPRISGSTLPDR
ncbi:phosphatase PAP2 family protein [Jatrophihabitans sp. YIM 134969]